MIKIKNLNVYYKNKNIKTQAILNLNMEAPKGEIYAIIGPSGSGKSTLLKVLAGIIKEYDGEVRVDEEKVDPNVHRIGFIPQNDCLIRWKNIKQNILLASKIKDSKRGIDFNFYKKLIIKLNIAKLVKRYPHQLSGGQNQRAAIARAFLLKPDLLLMDEPFSALDAITREEIQEVFLEIWEEYSVTTILITHDIKEAIYLGNKIAIFSPAPGSIIKTMNNPLFGKGDMALGQEYNALDKEIRQILRGE